MTAIYRKQGNIFSVGAKEALEFFDVLPGGNYTLQFNPIQGFYFEMADKFMAPPKLYGDVTRQAKRILRSFKERPAQTGCLLVGEKGSGKTLLARTLSSMALEEDQMPTIILNQAYNGDSFNSFIQSLHQPMILLFDEFEKVYDSDDQAKVLTLLDGVFPTKKLFLFTSNDKYKLTDHMRNRPGRIYYMIEFEGVEDDFIREYAKDQLKPHLQRHIERLLQVSKLFQSFNFDMVKAVCEEMNRYEETPENVLQVLNAKPEFNYKRNYEVQMWIKGQRILKEHLPEQSVDLQPMKPFSHRFHWIIGKDSDGDNTYESIIVTRSDMVAFGEQGFVFEKGNEWRVILKESSLKDNWKWKDL